MSSRLPLAPPTGRVALAAAAAAAVPLAAAWTAHAVVLQRRLDRARRDPLTGLLTRPGFALHATSLLARYGDQVTIGFVDLDFFKQVNDTAGHQAGDAVLIATARRLQEWAGRHAALGRLGGDEFVFAAPLTPARRTLRLQQLMNALRQPVDQVPMVSASIGAATAGVIGTRCFSSLLRAADVAMFRGKHSGQPIEAVPEDVTATTVNGRRAGRPGTALDMAPAA
ncbi:GGDEF domain-containing protein [Streptomyces sp. NPDC059718]